MEHNNEKLITEEVYPDNVSDTSNHTEGEIAIAGKQDNFALESKAKEVKTGRKRILEGRVVSNKPDKTIIIKVERHIQHPLYKKYFRRSKKLVAHDEHNECQVGDLVRIIEWRPLSKRKRWMLKEIVERAK